MNQNRDRGKERERENEGKGGREWKKIKKFLGSIRKTSVPAC